MLDVSKVFNAAACLAAILAAAAAAAAASPAHAPERLRAPMRLAQLSAPDLVLRIDRLEEEIRRLTGLVEQLQYRNQQLEQQLRRAQGGAAPGAQGDALAATTPSQSAATQPTAPRNIPTPTPCTPCLEWANPMLSLGDCKWRCWQ